MNKKKETSGSDLMDVLIRAAFTTTKPSIDYKEAINDEENKNSLLIQKTRREKLERYNTISKLYHELLCIILNALKNAFEKHPIITKAYIIILLTYCIIMIVTGISINGQALYIIGGIIMLIFGLLGLKPILRSNKNKLDNK